MGYGADLFGDCCSHREQTQVEHGKTAPHKQAPSKEDGCQCICHHSVTPMTIGPVCVSGSPVGANVFASSNEVAPDAVPIGIEYPPQLA